MVTKFLPWNSPADTSRLDISSGRFVDGPSVPGPVRCAAASAKGRLYLVAGEMGNSLYEVDLGSGRAEKLGMDHLHGDGCGMGVVPSAYGGGEDEEELVIVGGTWG